MKYLILFLFLSCSSGRQNGWDKRPDVAYLSETEARLMEKEAISLWNLRGQSEQLEQALSRFEMVHATKPKDVMILTYLTRGYYLLGDSHYQNSTLKNLAFEKAASFGEKGLATNEAFAKTVKSKSWDEGLKFLTVNEMPCLYWTAASLTQLAQSAGISKTLQYKKRIRILLERAQELKPDYFYGAIPRLWGFYYAIVPSMAGGDIEQSQKEFDKSLQMAPDFLGTKVLKAAVYWTQKKDKKAFKSDLQSVIESSVNESDRLAPENALEKQKASIYLGKVKELF